MTAFVNCEELPQGCFRKRSKKMKIEATSFKEKQKKKVCVFFFLAWLSDLLLLTSVGKTEQEAI